MKRILYVLTLALIGISLAAPSQAQFRSYKYWSLGISAGTSWYNGDMDDAAFQPWSSLGEAGTEARYHFHPHMSIAFGLSYTWLSAADSNATEERPNQFRQFRDLDFRNRVLEGSAILTYEFFGADRHYRFRPRFSPYIFAGVAVFYHNPYTYLRDEEVAFYANQGDAVANAVNQFENERIFLRDLRTEAQGSDEEFAEAPYNLVQFAIPFGVGLRWKLTDRFDLRLSLGVRKTFTDHLDDNGSFFYGDPEAYLEGRYASEDPALSFILSDRSGYREINGGNPGGSAYDVQQVDIARGFPINEDQGEKRGNPNNDDWYSFFGFTLNYILDPGDRCPKFR